jgi:hypothetical protein
MHPARTLLMSPKETHVVDEYNAIICHCDNLPSPTPSPRPALMLHMHVQLTGAITAATSMAVCIALLACR